MKLRPIKEKLEDNTAFANDSNLTEHLTMSVNYFSKIGYQVPWIGYYAEQDGKIVGSCAFKGKPDKKGKVEIAYMTFETFRNQGIGSAMCKALVDLAKAQEEKVNITARTLPEHNHSTRILEKNNFTFLGPVEDEEDGTVWEWQYKNDI